MGIRLESYYGSRPTIQVDYCTSDRAKVEEMVKTTQADIEKAQREIVAAEARIANCVQQLRAAGASWGVIGQMLGVTRAAAHKRWSGQELTATTGRSTRR